MTAPVLTGTGAAHVTGTGAGFAPHRGDERIVTCVEIGYGPPQTFGIPNGQWVDVTTNVRSLSTTRGRSQELQRFESGTLSMRLDNRSGNYSVWIGSGATIGCPVRVRISAEKSDPTGSSPDPAVYDQTDGGFFYVFYGFITDLTYGWAPGGSGDGWCDVHAADIFALLNRADLVEQIFPQYTSTQGPGGSVADVSGEFATDRLVRVIDAVGIKPLIGGSYIFREDKNLGGFPNQFSPYAPGLNSGAGFPISENSLSHLQSIAEGAFIDFYAGPDGILYWRPFSDVRDNAFDGTTIFGDNIPTEIPYQDASPDYSDQNLYNDVALTFVAFGPPMPETASDDASIALYGRRLFQGSYPIYAADSGYLVTAAIYPDDFIAKFKDPIVHVPSITVSLRGCTDAQRMRVLSLPIGYRVQVIRRPDAGDDLTAECHFEGISLTWQQGMTEVKATLNLAPVRPPGTYVGPLPL